MIRLFVYGTLRERASHEHLLPGKRIPATTTGQLISLPEGYPALIDTSEGVVIGECVDVEEHQLPTLDAYEEVGEHLLEYQRHPRSVWIDEKEVLAECYVLSPEGGQAWLDRGAYIIPTGDWLTVDTP
ncbi:MAG: gamma-glutamylcyclotransferase [Myxococcales bacterium]|nr:gamma-glutamylcyclotransferase [Myxococcales bacterium]